VPWFREITDGLSWLGYCKNTSCIAFKQLFAINRGFGVFKLEKELKILSCPVCRSKTYELRNCGFVNCEWILKGKLRLHEESKVFGDGKTYDGKLYTFKETNYGKTFETLDIMVKQMKEIKIKNISHNPSEMSSESQELHNIKL
jgi:hypothetical protein